MKNLKLRMAIEKAVQEGSRLFVEGFASHQDTDTYGDQISDEAMKQLAEKMVGVVLLHGHDSAKEVGKVEAAEYRAGDRACWVRAWLPLGDEIDDETKACAAKVQDGRLNAFSINAIPAEYKITYTKDVRTVTITAWERVVELSLTSVPVQEKATILNVYVKAFREQMDADDAEAFEAKVAALVDARVKDLAAAPAAEPVPEVEPAVEKADPAPEEAKAEDAPTLNAEEVAGFVERVANSLAEVAIEDETAKKAVAAIVAEMTDYAANLRQDSEAKPEEEPKEEPAPESTDEEKQKALARAGEAEAKIAALQKAQEDQAIEMARVRENLRKAQEDLAEAMKPRSSQEPSGQVPTETPAAPHDAFKPGFRPASGN